MTISIQTLGVAFLNHNKAHRHTTEHACHGQYPENIHLNAELCWNYIRWTFHYSQRVCFNYGVFVYSLPVASRVQRVTMAYASMKYFPIKSHPRRYHTKMVFVFASSHRTDLFVNFALFDCVCGRNKQKCCHRTERKSVCVWPTKMVCVQKSLLNSRWEIRRTHHCLCCPCCVRISMFRFGYAHSKRRCANIVLLVLQLSAVEYDRCWLLMVWRCSCTLW